MTRERPAPAIAQAIRRPAEASAVVAVVSARRPRPASAPAAAFSTAHNSLQSRRRRPVVGSSAAFVSGGPTEGESQGADGRYGGQTAVSTMTAARNGSPSHRPARHRPPELGVFTAADVRDASLPPTRAETCREGVFFIS